MNASQSDDYIRFLEGTKPHNKDPEVVADNEVRCPCCNAVLSINGSTLSFVSYKN